MNDSETNYVDFRNETYQNLAGYIPGEQPDSADWIKLNTNENPYPPAQKALEALQLIYKDPGILRKYPNPFGEPLRGGIAGKFGVKPENVIITNGSDEALSLICRVFLGRGRKAIAPEITYSLYETLVQATGAGFFSAAMRNYEMLNVSLDNLENSDAGCVFLSNPNAQTGEYILPENLLNYVSRSKKLWIIDEAYNDFVHQENPSFIKYLSQCPNAIVVRTFSKSHSLAGLRVGYLICENPVTCNGLLVAKDSYNEDAVALKIANESLNDEDYLRKTVTMVQQEKDKLIMELLARDFTLIPSQANFLLAKPPEGLTASQLQLKLKEKKILIRYFGTQQLSSYVRISIGNEDEMNRLIQAVDLVLSE